MATAKWLRIVTVVVAVLVLVAPTAATAGPHGAQERPFHTKWSGTFDMFGEPGWCEDGAVPVHIIGTGRASHVGRFELETWHCADFANNELEDGVEVWTAANGDKLYGTYEGILDPQVVCTHTYSGGTGRFLHATGTLGPSSPWITFTSETEGVLGGEMSGTISYDASDRSG